MFDIVYIGKMKYQLSISFIKKLSPPAKAKTGREQYLAQIARARKITRFDIAMAIVILLDFVLTYIDSITKWWYVGTIDLFLSGLLLLLVISMRTMRPLLGRLMLAGLIAGICELFTDASGQQVAHSLIYPAGELTLWTSPAHMPLSWMVILTPLGSLARRLPALAGWRKA